MNYFPKELAEATFVELQNRTVPCPKLEVLVELFELMYFVSLKTEETQSIVFHVVYLDPNNPDPNPPQRIVHDRWSVVRFAKPITASISNLVKLAKASDPRTSSLAVYEDPEEGLSIWGLIDQGNRYHDFVNHNSESGPERPGDFQASIQGVGHIVVYFGYEKVAELKVNTLVGKPLDVLRCGPIRETLDMGIAAYIETVKAKIGEPVHGDRSHWDSSLASYWISSLCRLLLRVQNYYHGGAILFTPDTLLDGLNVKYEIQYNRLRSALETRALHGIQETHASDQIFEYYLEEDADEIPVDLYLDEVIHADNLDHNRSEIDGTIWFISLLSRVDGLVLMTPKLEVQGFGVEITYSEAPDEVFSAGDYRATKSKLRKVDYNHYGTRHRSMMRYCSHVPGSIGFVISQDGDVRAMTQVRGQLVMWENIMLQLHDFARPKRKRRKKAEHE